MCTPSKPGMEPGVKQSPKQEACQSLPRTPDSFRHNCPTLIRFVGRNECGFKRSTRKPCATLAARLVPGALQRFLIIGMRNGN
jgi:hypothetical protein